MKRGQVSIEFIVIFGFVFLLIVPLIAIFFSQSGMLKDSIAENQMKSIALKIAEKAETVYYSGEPSRTRFRAYFPENIEYVNITPRWIDFCFFNSENRLDCVGAKSFVNLTGALSAGLGVHVIELESTGNGVEVRDA